MITRHIADLLYHHECVIVPGLGGFIKANNPAWILHSTHEFYPPSGSVAFNAGLSANDGLLANHIASRENISYREALYEIKVWTDTSLNKLKNDEKVTLEGIGDLFLNNSGKIEFTPAKLINFNADSFGLPVFRAKPVSLVQEALPDIQPAVRSNNNSKSRHLVPETLKWAAVLAPFIAFVLWGSIKGNLIDNYIHNYTGMYSWVRSTPGKTAPVNIASVPVTISEKPAEVIESPAGILADKNIAFNPGLTSYSKLAKKNIYFNDNELIENNAIPANNNEINSTTSGTNLTSNQNLTVKTGSFAKTQADLKENTNPKEKSNTLAKTNARPGDNAGSKAHTRIPAYPWLKNSPESNASISNTSKAETNLIAETKQSNNTLGFHIIGGAFREHKNALKLIEKFKTQGYSPAIVDTTPGGLYVVSIIGFSNLNEAENKLKEIKKDGYSTSWIMKKKKS